jgi:hypothetical protein
VSLETRLTLLCTRIGNYLRDSVLPRLIPTGGTTGQVLAKTSATNYAVGWVNGAGGADPWARTILAADYTNPLATFANITDGVTPWTYTPPANSNFTLEAEIILMTTTATNLPRFGVSVAAGVNNGYAYISTEQDGATATTEVVASGGYNNNAAIVIASRAIRSQARK